MFPKKRATSPTPPLSASEPDSDSASFPPIDLLTLSDHKPSLPDSDAASLQSQSHRPTLARPIHKRHKQDQYKRTYLNRKRHISYLQTRIAQLEREVASLRRNDHYCQRCSNPLSQQYLQRMMESIQPEMTPTPNQAGDLSIDGKKNSKDSVEFQQINLHNPLMQTQEMEQKLWIFVGTMLIAMGSKVTDFDGTINVFKVLRESVDGIRRQVQKSEPKLGMSFYCGKQQLNQPKPIDGMGFDPFYAQKINQNGTFSLEGVRLESVEEYELYYENKYHFHIAYDALLTIMEYARQHSAIT